MTNLAVFGDKKGSFTAEKLSEKSAVQTVQPVWDLLEIVFQKDDFSSENVRNGPRPEPSAAEVGAEAAPRYNESSNVGTVEHIHHPLTVLFRCPPLVLRYLERKNPRLSTFGTVLPKASRFGTFERNHPSLS